VSKDEIIKAIQELPDNLQAFFTLEGDFDDIDIRIFTKPKDQEFIRWYFGP